MAPRYTTHRRVRKHQPPSRIEASGSGVFEIALRFDKDAYRAVYAVQVGQRIYVLHAFQKKSKYGIKTPRQDMEVIEQRYRQALKMVKES